MNLQNGTPHQQVELKEIPLDVTDHIPQSGTCSSCGRKVKGDIPEGCQYFYGPRCTSFVASLVSRGIPRRVVEDLLRDNGLFVTSHGEPIRISQGGIQRMLDRAVLRCATIMTLFLDWPEVHRSIILTKLAGVCLAPRDASPSALGNDLGIGDHLHDSWGKKRECLPGAPRRLVWLSDIR